MKLEDRLALYDRIYTTDRLVHPKKGVLQPYGAQEDRDAPFVEFLTRHAPVPEFPIGPPTVLDASCGRGHLARKLKALGYNVDVTEISPGIVKELQAEFPSARVMDYAYLALMDAKSYDVVISNDVLEHLPEYEALAALGFMRNVARRWLLISVGLGRGAVKYPEALGLNLDLHLFTPGAARWERELQRVGRIEHLEKNAKTLWAFLEVQS